MEVISGKQAVPLEEVVLAQAFEYEALLNVLKRRGLVPKAEVLEEIKRLREKAPKGRVTPPPLAHGEPPGQK